MDKGKAKKRFSQKYLNKATVSGTPVHKLKHAGAGIDWDSLKRGILLACCLCAVYVAGYQSAVSNRLATDAELKDPRIELEELGLSSPVRESMSLGAIQNAQGFSEAYPQYQNKEAEEPESEEDEEGEIENEEETNPAAEIEVTSKPPSSEGLRLEELLVDFKEYNDAPFVTIPEKRIMSKKAWWALKNYEKAYSTHPIKAYVPRVKPSMQLSLEEFHEKFRKPGHPVIMSFENLRSLGFKTQSYTLSELKQMFPFNNETPSKVQKEFVANGIRKDDEELDLGPALVAIERDETLAKEGKLRNFPRNLKVNQNAISKLGIEKPPLVQNMQQFQLPTVWMGTSSSDTRFHHDCCDNFVMMITGTKRFTLAPTSDWRTLKPTCVGSKSNLCWANVPHPNAPDRQTAAHKKTMTKVNKIVVDVKPGEILYMPAGWFHHIENLGPTVMVNWWTKSGETIALKKALTDPTY
eukprot:CAMPEP_0204875350 /NCGR_PEP_ID=MMETSP1348-20121228/45658_1 /ASSEMBLY_ACC=CAM_ASM_000700 /TAXON_ID=215587 /ORGANISM="Aplanochytrium stocchinoi, Strain GSBS06" /LENGTH=465 /DNA_ID=CAMNT_0052031723 /DNA_START=27 /DNA_END=1424 /DNA_ORIENTATION=-